MQGYTVGLVIVFTRDITVPKLEEELVHSLAAFPTPLLYSVRRAFEHCF